MTSRSALPMRPGAVPISVHGGRIVFEDVTFHYGGHRTPLYDGLSVDIRAGERVGLVGRSGSGKTTFVKLVQRLYDVSGGRILIDGQDIANATQHSLRSQIAIVQQDPILFHRSLAENIAYGRPGASMAAIEQAARLANAHEFILRLPKGYGTLVGERGVKLSGGERQRVALARAFLADAPVLILDEATSSLEFRIGSPDPAGDGTADEGPHLDRDRAPAVDGAQPRPHPGVRPRRDRRAGHPRRARQPRRAESIAGCSSARRPNSLASRRRNDRRQQQLRHSGAMRSIEPGMLENSGSGPSDHPGMTAADGHGMGLQRIGRVRYVSAIRPQGAREDDD